MFHALRRKRGSWGITSTVSRTGVPPQVQPEQPTKPLPSCLLCVRGSASSPNKHQEQTLPTAPQAAEKLPPGSPLLRKAGPGRRSSAATPWDAALHQPLCSPQWAGGVGSHASVGRGPRGLLLQEEGDSPSAAWLQPHLNLLTCQFPAPGQSTSRWGEGLGPRRAGPAEAAGPLILPTTSWTPECWSVPLCWGQLG